MNFEKTSSIHEKIEISFREEWTQSTPKKIMKILSSGQQLNYDEKDSAVLDSEKIIHEGYQTYLISPISEKDKFSTKYINCHGLIASGIDKNTGKRISFLTHQDTSILLNTLYKDNFYGKIFEQLKKLQKLSKSGSIDTVVFGGNGFTTWAYENKSKREKLNNFFLNGLEVSSKVIKDTLGYYPRIAHSPKQNGGQNDVFFNTEENKLYIIDTGTPLEYSYYPFTWESIETMKKIWESTEYKTNKK